jgi:hypothetical protein
MSTREEVLLDLVEQHEVVSLIIQHRKLRKLLETIQNSLSSALVKARKTECGVGQAGSTELKQRGDAQEGGVQTVLCSAWDDPGSHGVVGWHPAGTRGLCRLKGSYQQTATSTGRLSMDDPNLQCIPNPVVSRPVLP